MRTLIVYGNCQAQNIAEVLKLNPRLGQRYRVLYLTSIKGAPQTEVSLDDVANCGLLLTMRNSKYPFPFAEHLPASAQTIPFMSLTLFCLYPFYSALNPYNVPNPPRVPWGPFPYGDQAIIDMIDRGLAAQEILRVYLGNWDAYGADLDRMLELDSARILAEEARCSVKMADVLFTTFQSNRPFFTVNHPTPFLYREQLLRMARAIRDADSAVGDIAIGTTFDDIIGSRPRGPLGSVIVPIHPRVAHHFSLSWYDPSERFELADGSTVDYRSYFTAMIDEFRRVKAASTAGELRVDEPLPSHA